MDGNNLLKEATTVEATRSAMLPVEAFPHFKPMWEHLGTHFISNGDQNLVAQNRILGPNHTEEDC